MSEPAEAFREFAASRAAPLHRSAYLLCGDWHLAHHLVQETIAVRMVAAVKQATSGSTFITTLNDGNQILTTYTDLAAPAMETMSTTESGGLRYQAPASLWPSPPAGGTRHAIR